MLRTPPSIQKRPIDKTKGKEAGKPDEFEYITVKISCKN
jgi:hypothetical protein